MCGGSIHIQMASKFKHYKTDVGLGILGNLDINQSLARREFANGLPHLLPFLELF